MKGTTTGIICAAAVAGLFAGTSAVRAAETGTAIRAASLQKASQPASIAGVIVAAEEAAGKHDCKGKNACKGEGGCKTGDNGCKGKNTCKGKGGCKSEPATKPGL